MRPEIRNESQLPNTTQPNLLIEYRCPASCLFRFLYLFQYQIIALFIENGQTNAAYKYKIMKIYCLQFGAN